MRGQLTEGIQKLAKDFLDREITITELRLYPYLDYVMKNSQKIEPNRISPGDREVLKILRREEHIEGGASGLSMIKEFYDYMSQVLWLGYVVAVYD